MNENSVPLEPTEDELFIEKVSDDALEAIASGTREQITFTGPSLLLLSGSRDAHHHHHRSEQSHQAEPNFSANGHCRTPSLCALLTRKCRRPCPSVAGVAICNGKIQLDAENCRLH